MSYITDAISDAPSVPDSESDFGDGRSNGEDALLNASGSADTGRNEPFDVVDTGFGIIRYYRPLLKDPFFVGHRLNCDRDGRCRLTKSACAYFGKSSRPSQGRPLGLIFAWLLAHGHDQQACQEPG